MPEHERFCSDESSLRSITIERVVRAPVERVFVAWSDATIFGQWIWGKYADGVECSIDFRIGGEYRCSTRVSDNEQWVLYGTFSTIEPNRLIECSLWWDAPMGYEVKEERIQIGFQSAGRSTTRMRFTHAEIPGTAAAEEHEKGWQHALGYLERVVNES